MSRGVLRKIEPIHPPMKPPKGAVAAGVTPDGHQLYREHSKRSRSIPDIDEETGQQRQRRHALTGEPLYGIRKPEPYTLTRLYFLEDQGNGNIVKVDYREPTPEEMAAKVRAREIELMKDTLAATMVDSGLSPSELVRRLTAPVTAAAPAPAAAPEAETLEEEEEEVEEEELPQVVYPVHRGGKSWLLSSGDLFNGKKDEATKAEDALPPEKKNLLPMAEQKAREDAQRSEEY